MIIRLVKIRHLLLTVAVPLLFVAFARMADCQVQGASANWSVKQLVYEVQSRSVQVLTETFVTILGSNIFVKDGPNAKPRRLAEGQAPVLSPDGNKIAYLPFHRPSTKFAPTTNGPAADQIRIINADGSGKKQLTAMPMVSPMALAWSPAEEKIAYCDSEGVVVFNVDGSGQERITNHAPIAICSVDWSPNGEKIAYTSMAGDKVAVGVIDKNGRNDRIVVKGYRPKWSPDGKQLLFLHDSEKFSNTTSIWIVNADGTAPRKVLEGKTEDFGQTWLPNGKSIAFASAREHKLHSEIFRINVDGTGLEKIASGTKRDLSFSSPLFSPDGNQLVVEAVFRNPNGPDRDEFSIWLIDIASQRQQRLATGYFPGVFWENNVPK